MSKLKRSSFRIDDILSLKTQCTDRGEYSSCHGDQEGTSEEDFDIDVGCEDDGSLSGISMETGDEPLDVGVEGLCDVTGRDSPESGGLPSGGDVIAKARDREFCDTNVLQKEFLASPKRTSPSPISRSTIPGFPFSSKLSTVHKLSCGQMTDDKKTYPITPRATKLPNSLESLVKTQRPSDYFLQLSSLTQKLGSQWPLFRSELFMGMPGGHFPPGMGLHGLGGLSPTDQKTPCICGSPTCAERTEALHSEGPHNFLRPSNSPNSPAHDPSLSIPVPLPVYVRTRDPTSLDGSMKAKKCRRSRTVFTELQLMGLEKKFETQKYLSTPDRLDIAETLGLTQLQVKTWYQNRRMKWKKQVMQGGGTEPPTKPKGRPRKDSIYPEGSPCSSVDMSSDKLL